MLSFRSFIVSRFTFRSVFHFALNFVYGMRYRSKYFLLSFLDSVFSSIRGFVYLDANLLGNSAVASPAGSRASSTLAERDGTEGGRHPVARHSAQGQGLPGGRRSGPVVFPVGEREREDGGRREKGLWAGRRLLAFRSPPPSPPRRLLPPRPRHSTRTHPPPTPGLPRWTLAPGCRLQRRLSPARPPGYIPRGWGAEVPPATHLWPRLPQVATAQSGASGASRGLWGGAARLPVAAGPGPVFPAGRRLSFALLSARSPGASPRPPTGRPAGSLAPFLCCALLDCATLPVGAFFCPRWRGKGAWDVGAGKGHGSGARGGCRLGARGFCSFSGEIGGGEVVGGGGGGCRDSRWLLASAGQAPRHGLVAPRPAGGRGGQGLGCGPVGHHAPASSACPFPGT